MTKPTLRIDRPARQDFASLGAAKGLSFYGASGGCQEIGLLDGLEGEN